MWTRQKQRVATDSWRSLGCRTTPLEYWSKTKPTVEPRWAKQQTKMLRPQLTKINSFMSGSSLCLTLDPPFIIGKYNSGKNNQPQFNEPHLIHKHHLVGVCLRWVSLDIWGVKKLELTKNVETIQSDAEYVLNHKTRFIWTTFKTRIINS